MSTMTKTSDSFIIHDDSGLGKQIQLDPREPISVSFAKDVLDIADS